MNGSVVTAKIAGIESTAKIRSVASTSSSTRKSGVAASAAVLAGRRSSGRGSRSVTGISRRTRRTTGFFSGLELLVAV